MWNLISHFLTFAGGMASGVMLMLSLIHIYSSDGRKDGFAIEVKSADGSYCETFTTPKSGVIEVKGLRVGIYTCLLYTSCGSTPESVRYTDKTA